MFGVVSGVLRTRVGYSGGSTPSPTYTSLGDHTESIQMDFDPDVISYEKLLDMFWKNHDCKTKRSRQYRSAILFHDEEQKLQALTSLAPHKGAVTSIEPYKEFFLAEMYHQKYMLQRSSGLTAAALQVDASLVDGTLACRLNGYLGGYGGMHAFETDQVIREHCPKGAFEAMKKFLKENPAGSHDVRC
jgi:peptide-methionine (S)-S-oxide reductase